MQTLFVNLAVKDVKKSTEFYIKLGFKKINHFSNDKVSCIQLSKTNYFMLLEDDIFKSFIPNHDLTPRGNHLNQLNSLMLSSVDEVNQMCDIALSLGAKEIRPAELMGEGMYVRTFTDLDGYGLEIGWMALELIPIEMR